MAKELWKEIDGFNGIYKVSTNGRVKSFMFNKKGRLLSPQLVGGNKVSKYLLVALSKNEKIYQRYVHRLVLQTFTGPCPDNYQTHHKDFNKRNNFLSNLEWVLKKHNQQNKRTNKMNKLGADILRDLHKKLGFSKNELKDMFKMSYSNVANIISGRTWI